MIKLYATLISLFFLHISYAQITFSKSYDIDGYSDTGTGIIEHNGSFYIAVGSLCNGNNSGCYSIIKTDLTGGVKKINQFTIHPQTIQPSTSPSNSGILLKNDSSIFICGVVTLDTPFFNYDNFLLKANMDGDSIWMQTYGTSYTEVNYTVLSKTDTSLLLYSNKGLTPNVVGEDELWLFETDLEGNMVWEGFYGQQYGMVARQDIEVLDNGNIAFSYLGCESTVFCDTQLMNVTLIDPLGEEIWTSTFSPFAGPVGSAPSSSLVALDNGGFVVDYNREFWPVVNDPPILVWLDSIGNVTDQHNFQWTDLSYISDMFLSSKGELIVVGNYDHINIGYGFAAWILAFSQDGDLLWERTVLDMNFPLDSYWINAGTETSDGGFILTGTIQGETNDVWLLKLDSIGCLEPGCEDMQIITSDKEALAQESECLFRVYPNPVRGQVLHIEAMPGQSLSKDVHLKLVNAFGQTVLEKEWDNFTMETILVQRIPSGFYHLIISDEDGHVLQVEGVVVP